MNFSMSDTLNDKNKKIKKRNWACVVYPESLPRDWVARLQESGLECAISPLHDKDINPDGTPKKPHYHIILVYAGPTTWANVKQLTDELNAPGPIPLDQIRGYYRYLTHKDNPEKAQYDEHEISKLNGFNIADFVELTKSEVDEIKKKLIGVIVDNKLKEYSDFIDYVICNCDSNDFTVASGHTFFFHTYISSRRWK